MTERGRRPKARTHIRAGGLAFLAIFFMVEIAAFNTAENLLYILAALALGFPALAWLVCRIAFRGLSIHREAPEAVHRAEPFDVAVHARNRNHVIPSVSLRACFAGEEFAPVFLPVLPPKSSAIVRMKRTMPRRGVHRLPGIRIASAFPMGLFERSLTHEDGLEIVVYPRVHRIDRAALERLDDTGNRLRRTFATGDEFYALREYVPGDDIRFICWRVSARLGELIVRELEPGSVRSIVIVLDARGIPSTPDAQERFELAIELAASLAVAFLDRQYSVSLVTTQAVLPLGQGEGQIVRVLDCLARVLPVEYETCGDDWFRASGDVSGATKVCVATDSSRWGGLGLNGSVRVLDPEEVLHAT